MACNLDERAGGIFPPNLGLDQTCYGATPSNNDSAWNQERRRRRVVLSQPGPAQSFFLLPSPLRGQSLGPRKDAVFILMDEWAAEAVLQLIRVVPGSEAVAAPGPLRSHALLCG